MAALPPNAKGWSVVDVKQWAVAEVGIKPEHADKLVQQEVDGEELLHLSEAKLERWGIPGGPAGKLMRAIEGLCGGGGSSSVAAAERSAGVLPVVSETTVAFWRAARSGQLDLGVGNTLQLPPDLAGSSRPVFVRESYVELVDALLPFLHTFENIGQMGNAAVYGTPGIGKSVFASLLVGWIGRHSPGATVLYTAASTNASDKYILFSPDDSVHYVSAAKGEWLRVELGRSLAERLVWVIADGKEPPSGALTETNNYRLRTVLVSSSNMGTKQWLREWHKHVYMALLASPFSWDEVMLAASLRGVEQHELGCLAERFRVFGGVPRLVFDSGMVPGEWLAEMVPLDQKRLIDILDDTLEGVLTEGREKSRVIHLYPATAVPQGRQRMDYMLRVAQFASPTVARALVEQLDAASKKVGARKLMNANAVNDGATVSLLFEPWMHAALKRGQSFVADAPNSSPEAVMPAPVRSLLFPTGTTLANAEVGVYMEPQSKSFPSVDSFIRLADGRVLLFQMTGQASHPINMPGLKALFDVPVNTPGGCNYHAGKDRDGNDVLKCVFVPPNTALLFVVMPRVLDSFAIPQNYVGKSGGAALASSRNPEKYIAERLAQTKVAPSTFELR